MAEYLLITGMSGAGRSQAGATMEDLGWFVIDNLPTALITKVAELADLPGAEPHRVVLVIGRDAAQLGDLSQAVSELRATGSRVTVLFLDAADEVLVRRFEGTRRRHPLGHQGVTESIAGERKQLETIRASADVIVDTTDLNVHQLRDRLRHLFADVGTDGRGPACQPTMRVTLVSFGFKYGVPIDVDSLFDCRFLPNPHWHDDLRPMTGLDGPVRDFVLGQPEAKAFLTKLDDLLELLLPAYVNEGKAYLTIGIGCTGGRHRSVAIAEELARCIRERGFAPSVQHRDLDR